MRIITSVVTHVIIKVIVTLVVHIVLLIITVCKRIQVKISVAIVIIMDIARASHPRMVLTSDFAGDCEENRRWDGEENNRRRDCEKVSTLVNAFDEHVIAVDGCSHFHGIRCRFLNQHFDFVHICIHPFCSHFLFRMSSVYHVIIYLLYERLQHFSETNFQV